NNPKFKTALDLLASFMSRHQNLAGRWNEFTGNPIAISLFESMGMKSGDLDEWGNNPKFKTALDLLASSETTIGHVPGSLTRREDFWMFTTWIGSQAQKVRLGLATGSIPDVVFEGRYSGRAIWRVESRGGGRPNLYFTVVEGFVAGCFSHDPRSIGALMDAFDGLAPSVEDILDPLPPPTGSPSPLDRGWYRNRAAATQPTFAFSLKQFSRDGAEVSLRFPGLDLSDADPVASLKAGELIGLMGDLPEAVIASDARTLGRWLGKVESRPWNDLLGVVDVFRQPVPMTLAIFGHDYSGRYKGLRMPTVLLGVQKSAADDGPAWVQQTLDYFNRQYKLGLITREVQEGGRSLYVVETALDNGYAKLAREERYAYTFLDEWCFLSTNLKALKQLVQRHDAPEAAEAEPVPWIHLWQSRSGEDYFSLDLMRGAKTMRNTFAVYAIMLGSEDPSRRDALVKQMENVQSWVDALSTFEFLQARVRKSEDLEIDLRFGPR
ncbi:MAG: hypothetical protein AAF492_21460, partial [Verrucomicrobiota bacterium]